MRDKGIKVKEWWFRQTAAITSMNYIQMLILSIPNAGFDNSNRDTLYRLDVPHTLLKGKVKVFEVLFNNFTGIYESGLCKKKTGT